MKWPLLPDGTVDWASAFEDEDTGLISLIDKADSEEKLKACCEVVIHMLFQRDSDSSFRFEYLRHLNQLFSPTGNGPLLITLKGRIRVWLRRLKAERMGRALAHARMQAGTATAEDEQRMASDDPLVAIEALTGDDTDDESDRETDGSR